MFFGVMGWSRDSTRSGFQIVAVVRFTAERFERLAGGKRSATTGTDRPDAPHPGGMPDIDAGQRRGVLASLRDAIVLLPRVPVVFAALDHRLISESPPG